MKIGIVTSGVDMLVLFRFLAKYDFSYEICYDDLGWPWADKPLEFVKERAQKCIAYLIDQGCEKIIVSPVLEVAFHHEKKYHDVILPLRNDYLAMCLEISPVGKIGLAGEYVDVMNKQLFEKLISDYKPNSVQQQRADEIAQKKNGYAWQISLWRNEIVMRKYYLTKLSFSSQIVHNAMKADRRYFKDAGVDTIVPVNYGFFAYETSLGKFLNTSKQKFHRLAAVEKAFDALTKNSKSKTQNYMVTIHYTGTPDHLTREKKRMYMLQRGKKSTVEMKRITL